MTVLQNGFPKSGNYWLFSILTQCLDAAGVEPKSVIRNHPIQPVAQTWPLSYPEQAGLDVLDIEPGRNFLRIASYFREPVEDLPAYVEANRLVWTHSRWISESAEVYRLFDKVVYIIRDPRDAAISMAHFAFTPYRMRTAHNPFSTPEEYIEANLLKHVSGWCQHVGSHLLAPPPENVMVVFYEALRADFATELDRILAHLELDVPTEARAQIAEAVTVKSMQKKSKGHVRSGKAGGWREALSPAQVTSVNRLAGGMIAELGYARRAEEESAPALPADLNKKALRRAMRRAMIWRGVNLIRGNRRNLSKPDAARLVTS